MERELAGGTLPEESESNYVEELEWCWWAMTGSEQQEIERAIADEHPIDAPADIGAEDVNASRKASTSRRDGPPDVSHGPARSIPPRERTASMPSSTGTAPTRGKAFHLRASPNRIPAHLTHRR